MLTNLPYEMLLNIINYLQGDEFYRFVKISKIIYTDFSKILQFNKEYKWVHIFLQVNTNNIFSKNYKFMLSRNGDIMKKNIIKHLEITGDTLTSVHLGRKYSYTNLCFDKHIRNIRLYKNNIYFTQIIDKNYIKFNQNPTEGNKIIDIFDDIENKMEFPRYEPKLKNCYYVIFNCVDNKRNRVRYDYLYNEWDFEGIYICDIFEYTNITLLFVFVSVILKSYT